MVINIKEGTKIITAKQFAGNVEITELVIANTVEEIGEGAFSKCHNLKKITWGKHVRTIGKGAFSKCTSLVSLHLPKSIKRVEKQAFAFCSSLAYVEFSDKKDIYIGQGAFANCTGLIYAILPIGLKGISNELFSKCTNLSDVFIPGTVTNIGYNAFYDATTGQIDLPDSLVAIDMHAFYRSKLTSVVIPDGVMRIDLEAFRKCCNLRCVDIGKSVSFISDEAFEDCPALSEVTFRSARIHYIGKAVFKCCKNLKRINVPASAIDKYKILLPKHLHKKLVGF